MLLRKISTSILLVLSISCIANAELGPRGGVVGEVGAVCPPDCGNPMFPQPEIQPRDDGRWQGGNNNGNHNGGGRSDYNRPGRGGGGGYNGGGRWPGRPQPPRPPQYGYWQYDTQRVYVGRSVMNEKFYLRQAAGLDGTYRGWEVTSVHAVTSPNSPGKTIVQLVADGRAIATQVNPGRQINLVPNSAAILDRNINSLQL